MLLCVLIVFWKNHKFEVFLWVSYYTQNCCLFFMYNIMEDLKFEKNKFLSVVKVEDACI